MCIVVHFNNKLVFPYNTHILYCENTKKKTTDVIFKLVRFIVKSAHSEIIFVSDFFLFFIAKEIALKIEKDMFPTLPRPKKHSTAAQYLYAEQGRISVLCFN